MLIQLLLQVEVRCIHHWDLTGEGRRVADGIVYLVWILYYDLPIITSSYTCKPNITETLQIRLVVIHYFLRELVVMDGDFD